MRTFFAASALAAFLSFASPAAASPAVVLPTPVVADTAAPLRLYGSRIGGGYSTTVYEWVYVPGPVRHRDAFGRVHHHPGRYEQRPRTVWVPHTVIYPRLWWRGDGAGISAAVTGRNG
jgi:hypothetical protein